MSDYIAEIQSVFLKLHGCEASYVETVPVVEEYQGKTIWEGDVEVFDLTEHPKANAVTDGDTRPLKAEGGVTSRS